MKYYLIDDELGVLKTLERIIEDRVKGEIIGFSTDPTTAQEEVRKLKPDVLIVDYLMAGMDGVSFIKSVKNTLQNTAFVMLSKVRDKKMVEQAYDSGIKFFISKPINVIEIQSVLKNVEENLKMTQIYSSIRGIITADSSDEMPVTHDERENIGRMLTNLGMMGEKGSTDINNLCIYLMDNKKEYSKETLNEMAISFGDTPKNIEQRMRRAMKKGLTNVANIGLEDYENEVFQTYATYVYDFSTIKEEMQFIKTGKGNGGRISTAKFINGMIFYCNSIDK